MKITDTKVDAITLTFRWNDTIIGLGQISEIVDPDMLDSLSNIDDKSIKKEVALNPYTSKTTLARLAKDDNPKICALVATHPTTAPAVLSALAKKDVWMVQLAVAKNPNTPPHALSILSKNIDVRIRSAVAKNPSAYSETLIYLLEESIKKDDKDVLVSLATNINAPFRVFAELHDNKYNTVRRAIASNPKLPSRFIKRLSQDSDVLVKKSIINNSSVSKTVLISLMKTESNKTLCTILTRRLAS